MVRVEQSRLLDFEERFSCFLFIEGVVALRSSHDEERFFENLVEVSCVLTSQVSTLNPNRNSFQQVELCASSSTSDGSMSNGGDGYFMFA
jgi:3-oxoacyl-[acyl-carrier-protein] synthase III